MTYLLKIDTSLKNTQCTQKTSDRFDSDDKSNEKRYSVPANKTGKPKKFNKGFDLNGEEISEEASQEDQLSSKNSQVLHFFLFKTRLNLLTK